MPSQLSQKLVVLSSCRAARACEGCGADNTVEALLAVTALLVGSVVLKTMFEVVGANEAVGVDIIVPVAVIVDLERNVERFKTCWHWKLCRRLPFPAFTTPGISSSWNGKGEVPCGDAFFGI